MLEYYKKHYKRLQNSHEIGYNNNTMYIYHPTKGITQFEIDKIYIDNNVKYVICKNQYIIELCQKIYLTEASFYLKELQKIYITDFIECNKDYIGIYNIGKNYFVLFDKNKIGNILKIENFVIYFQYKQKFYKINSTMKTTLPILTVEQENHNTNIVFDKDNYPGIKDEHGFTIFHANYQKIQPNLIQIEGNIYQI